MLSKHHFIEFLIRLRLKASEEAITKLLFLYKKHKISHKKHAKHG